ncbi:N(2)-acetyl-L-2,4-diaminobutanoate deacetylase DoeB2 [Mycolicibacter senuensis]|uniref:Peptidase n=1 Tax=Mycolicibacter senuensis TaxID=386913 RepID=A0A7I9XQA6_9MYCO|nr:N(2)-acetyl-L-2,4-diaminobutanoate deacetylase DoeB2 [Mycolicibacter senuensis]ORW66833.1 peptidase M20 [Mycolicibacter senuensis]GFG72181.1 peptidase [Mycolicibacter senuensis]
MSTSWPETVEQAQRLRRDLHRRPETAWAEHATAAAVRQLLDDAGIAHRVCADTGTVATLAPNAPGRHVALRADLDALPITEETGLEHASQYDGVMHACGHDGHTATLIAVAHWLKTHEDTLPGPVTLLFQPAEEGGHGAARMIDDGCLSAPRPVEVIFGWHNWPTLPAGTALCPDGAVMAANGTFRVELHGHGGHASQPETTRDPVLAAAAVTLALQQVVARRLAPQQAAVLAVTSLEAAAAATVTPEVAALGGSIRVPDLATRDAVFAAIEQIATATATAHQVSAKVHTYPRYDATVNHPGPAGELRAALATVFGTGWAQHQQPAPVLASEDFSYYLQRVPGAFALIGGGRDDAAPLHNPRYDFDDALIDPVGRLLIELAGAKVPAGSGFG